MAKKYRVEVGLDHKERQEPGEVYSGPAKSVPWLLELGALTEITDAPASDAEGDD